MQPDLVSDTISATSQFLGPTPKIGRFAAIYSNNFPGIILFVSSELISINKRFNGNDDDDFNMRHAWNSLCNDYNLKFKYFSKEYYPKSNDLVKYMNHFAEHYSLNIEFGVDIKIITKNLIHSTVIFCILWTIH